MKSTSINISRFFIKTYALIQIVFALILTFGGAYLLYLGGSIYYLFTGILLLISGIYIFRIKLSGTKIFAVIFVYTLIWTMWEAGTRFWGWIPRLATIAIFAFFLTLLLPYFEHGIRIKIAYSFTGLIVICFFTAGALAWYPYFTTLDNSQIPQNTTNTYHSVSAQPDDDWRYYGRDTQGTRFSPSNQITPENINQLKQVWVTRTGDMPPIDKKINGQLKLHQSKSMMLFIYVLLPIIC